MGGGKRNDPSLALWERSTEIAAKRKRSSSARASLPDNRGPSDAAPFGFRYQRETGSVNNTPHSPSGFLKVTPCNTDPDLILISVTLPNKIVSYFYARR